jgi:predicted glycoside hydrolase/deacetylase ChbG (UPF0249 family)
VKFLIVNADDFGASDGVNRGIIEACEHGIVTSTSLMVTGPTAPGAVELARRHPELSIGLHWDLDSPKARRSLDLGDAAAVRAELARQLEAFSTLVGRTPTHLDSHHHVHRRPEVAPIAGELAAPLRVPLRGDGRVEFVGGFYGQWEYGITDLHRISPEFMIWILRNEVAEGWTEIGCHPGYAGGDFTSVYLAEREVEVQTLKEPRIREEIRSLGIRLASHHDLPDV